MKGTSRGATHLRGALNLLAVGLLVLLATAALAAPGYDLSWWTVDGGGGSSQGSGYSLAGTTGQTDAGALRGGAYALTGGFWGGATPPPRAYLPLVLRNYP